MYYCAVRNQVVSAQRDRDLTSPPVILFSAPSAALTGRYPMDSTLNDCLARIAHLESVHARLRFPAPAVLFDIR